MVDLHSGGSQEDPREHARWHGCDCTAEGGSHHDVSGGWRERVEGEGVEWRVEGEGEGRGCRVEGGGRG